jgi:bacillithiol biosynthesis deacetylase BshB2
MERQVLVLFPHPDDETLAVGGAIAVHANAGSPITYGCFTLGQMGRNMGKPFFANRETLPDIREGELREACRALGIGDLRLLGYRDKTLEFEDPEQLVQEVSSLIAQVGPSLIITYYPGYCVHPDHEAVAAATVTALSRMPEQERPVLQCQAFSRGHEEVLGRRDVILDTSGVWESIYRAWCAHQSQTAVRLEQVNESLSGSPEEREQAILAFSKTGLYTYRV